MFLGDIVKMICSLKRLLRAAGCRLCRVRAHVARHWPLHCYHFSSAAGQLQPAACSLLAMTLQLQDHCSSAALQLTTITQPLLCSSTADNCNLNICTAPLSIVISNVEAD